MRHVAALLLSCRDPAFSALFALAQIAFPPELSGIGQRRHLVAGPAAVLRGRTVLRSIHVLQMVPVPPLLRVVLLVPYVRELRYRRNHVGVLALDGDDHVYFCHEGTDGYHLRSRKLCQCCCPFQGPCVLWAPESSLRFSFPRRVALRPSIRTFHSFGCTLIITQSNVMLSGAL